VEGTTFCLSSGSEDNHKNPQSYQSRCSVRESKWYLPGYKSEESVPTDSFDSVNLTQQSPSSVRVKNYYLYLPHSTTKFQKVQLALMTQFGKYSVGQFFRNCDVSSYKIYFIKNGINFAGYHFVSFKFVSCRKYKQNLQYMGVI
jgi:hypothetical protein